jgi:hypothetical protein
MSKDMLSRERTISYRSLRSKTFREIAEARMSFGSFKEKKRHYKGWDNRATGGSL